MTYGAVQEKLLGDHVPRKGEENNSFIHSTNIYWAPVRCQSSAIVGEFMRAVRLKCLRQEQRPEPE